MQNFIGTEKAKIESIAKSTSKYAVHRSKKAINIFHNMLMPVHNNNLEEFKFRHTFTLQLSDSICPKRFQSLRQNEKPFSPNQDLTKITNQLRPNLLFYKPRQCCRGLFFYIGFIFFSLAHLSFNVVHNSFRFVYNKNLPASPLKGTLAEYLRFSVCPYFTEIYQLITMTFAQSFT